ncbi:MAG: hypothetical protein K2Y18_06105 [Alphaproteobacteria bacterium]|jgi:thiol-disulfide isomerase/thioredoxin|nr:hypothetical protein [Alphaproteobacteria bacterium]
MIILLKFRFLTAFLILLFLVASNAYAKPTVYDFAASWCEPCKRDVNRDNILNSEGIANFVLVIEDNERAKGEAFVAAAGPNFPVEYDDGHAKANSMGAAGSTPSLVIVGSDGKTEVVMGSIGIDELRAKIKAHS